MQNLVSLLLLLLPSGRRGSQSVFSERMPLERVLKSHLNHSRIPQAPHSGLKILRERLTVRIHVYRNQRTEVARLHIALNSSASIWTTVYVRVPERTYIEDLEAILKIMT